MTSRHVSCRSNNFVRHLLSRMLRPSRVLTPSISCRSGHDGEDSRHRQRRRFRSRSPSRDDASRDSHRHRDSRPRRHSRSRSKSLDRRSSRLGAPRAGLCGPDPDLTPPRAHGLPQYTGSGASAYPLIRLLMTQEEPTLSQAPSWQ